MADLSALPEDLQAAVAFHGHLCPGILIGYRAARIAMRTFGLERAYDEEMVCVVENSACGVDAVQVLTGCTFGKGNLFCRDNGKQVFTFARRADLGRAVRVSLKPMDAPDLGGRQPEEVSREEFRQAKIHQFMHAPEEEMYWVDEVSLELPPPAQVLPSVLCDNCGEPVMETRLVSMGAKRLCIPCFEGWDATTVHRSDRGEE